MLDEFIAILNVRHIAYVDEFTNWLERRADKTAMANYYYKVGYEVFAVKKRNFTLASSYLEKGIKIAPTNAGILFGSCIVNSLTKNYAESLKHGISYLNLHGENAEMYFYVGNAQVKSGNPQIGQQNLAKAYKLNPELKNN